MLSLIITHVLLVKRSRRGASVLAGEGTQAPGDQLQELDDQRGVGGAQQLPQAPAQHTQRREQIVAEQVPEFAAQELC